MIAYAFLSFARELSLHLCRLAAHNLFREICNILNLATDVMPNSCVTLIENEFCNCFRFVSSVPEVLMLF